MWIRNYAIPAVPLKQSYAKRIKAERKKRRNELFAIRANLKKLRYTFQKLKYLNEISEYKKNRYVCYRTLRTAWVPKAEGLCEICKKEESYCKHHIIPLSKGGSNREENLIDVCRTCHNAIHPFMHGSKEFDYPETYRAEIEDKQMKENYFNTVSK